MPVEGFIWLQHEDAQWLLVIWCCSSSRVCLTILAKIDLHGLSSAGSHATIGAIESFGELVLLQHRECWYPREKQDVWLGGICCWQRKSYPGNDFSWLCLMRAGHHILRSARLPHITLSSALDWGLVALQFIKCISMVRNAVFIICSFMHLCEQKVQWQQFLWWCVQRICAAGERPYDDYIVHHGAWSFHGSLCNIGAASW